MKKLQFGLSAKNKANGEIELTGVGICPITVPYEKGLGRYLANEENRNDYLDSALDLGDAEVTSLVIKNILEAKKP